MFGAITVKGQGTGDLLLAQVAARLKAMGWPLAGVIQQNTETDPSRPCDMDLVVLQGMARLRISQDLGAMSQGCRLDPAALERAVGLVEATLNQVPPRLLIVNKFGRQEAEGRGFRPLIGQALGLGVPVLTLVAPEHRQAFDAFADGMADILPPEVDAVLGWCRHVADAPAAPDLAAPSGVRTRR